MDDCIYRQEAIDAVYYATADGDKADFCVDVIRSIPSADVVLVRHGRWLYKAEIYDESTWECSECGEPYTLLYGTPSDNRYNYCPNCGARMDTNDPEADYEWSEEEQAYIEQGYMDTQVGLPDLYMN